MSPSKATPQPVTRRRYPAHPGTAASLTAMAVMVIILTLSGTAAVRTADAAAAMMTGYQHSDNHENSQHHSIDSRKIDGEPHKIDDVSHKIDGESHAIDGDTHKIDGDSHKQDGDSQMMEGDSGRGVAAERDELWQSAAAAVADMESMFNADNAIEKFANILEGMEETFAGGPASGALAREVRMFDLLEAELRSERRRLEALPAHYKTSSTQVRPLPGPGNRTLVTTSTVVKESSGAASPANSGGGIRSAAAGSEVKWSTPAPQPTAGAVHIWEHKQVEVREGEEGEDTQASPQHSGSRPKGRT